MINWSQTFGILTQHDIQMLFVKGFETTIELFVLSWIGAFALGAALTVLRASEGKVSAFVVVAFVEYHRNVPSIVQFLIWYFGVPQLLPQSWQDWTNAHHSEMIFAVIALTLNAAAYVSEDLRSGFRALPSGQMEAARALGMSYLKTMRWVLIPQAVRSALPALLNQTLGLFKATSLAMAIGAGELMDVARRIDGETYATFAAYLVPTVIYLLTSTLIMLSGEHLQGRLQNVTRRTA